MYFFCKTWTIWTIYDEFHQKCRVIDAQELDHLLSLFPQLFTGQNGPFVAIQASLLPLVKLQQTKLPESVPGTEVHTNAAPKYIACKVANTWMLYEMAEVNSRSLTSTEISFLRTFFPTLVSQASAIVEAMQLTTIAFPRLQLLTTPKRKPTVEQNRLQAASPKK